VNSNWAPIAFSNISKAVTWGPSVQVREEEEDGQGVKVIVNAVLLGPERQARREYSRRDRGSVAGLQQRGSHQDAQQAGSPCRPG